MARAQRATSETYHHGDLRNALLAAAVELIAERGVAGLSLREAARRVGVSHAAPYRHFPDRAALLLAVADEGFGRLVEAARAAMDGIEDPSERLRAYGLEYIRFARRNPVHFRVMFSEELPKPDADTTDRAPFATVALELLFEAAGAAVRPGVDAEDRARAAVAAWSMTHGFATLVADGRLPDELVADERAADELARWVLLRLSL
ncbi:MAG: TetR/AcrR family transcriptional regulator [Alphaproteobacteria bacterium]|nr:TetR/AcrR family transcriptional regulator [Alphaproteobacteria bacterium]MCB9697430.1 TetR/AcrR family transcriptional regulator [Alphaproteobacteria bacterium]